MYFDSVVVSGLIIVALTCYVFVYVGRYAYQHFKSDLAVHAKETQKPGE